MTISIHDSLYAVFRVGKPQYDLLRFDFQVGVWRDRRLPDRRRLLLLPVLREPAPGEQPDGAERCAGDVQLALRRRQPELRQLLPVQHRPDLHLLHSGGLIQPHLMRQGGGWGRGGGLRLIDQQGFCSIHLISHCKTHPSRQSRSLQHPVVSMLLYNESNKLTIKQTNSHWGEGEKCRNNAE